MVTKTPEPEGKQVSTIYHIVFIDWKDKQEVWFSATGIEISCPISNTGNSPKAKFPGPVKGHPWERGA